MFNFISKYISKKSKTNKNNNNSKKNNNALIGGKTKKELCSHKYKDKAIRGTPKNWAYKRCMKQGWERCKNLPPAGYNMHRDFCD